MPLEDEFNLLVIVVDVNPVWWGQQAQQRDAEITLSKCLDAVMVVGNAHMVMSRTNKLAVIASHCQDSYFLYPSKNCRDRGGAGDGPAEHVPSSSGNGKYELLSVANDLITEGIRNIMSRVEVKGHSTHTLLTGSLAKALCYIHRVTKELEASQEMKSRILVVKVAGAAAEDCALQYTNFMNVVFAAQKQNILIDACVLDLDSSLLQQACDMTGGLYVKVPQKIALAQYLLWIFLPDADQRSQLVLPPPVDVDYRPACFCHRNLVEIGHVCSVCLSIFCKFSPICPCCEAAFKPLLVKSKKKIKPSI